MTLLEQLAGPPISRRSALERMERLNAVTQIVSSTEHLARPEDRTRGGWNDWDVARRSLHRRAPRFTRIIDIAARPTVTKALHAARAAAGLALLAPTGRRTRTAANAVIVGSSLLLHPRSHYGTDGTDQVGFLVSSASTLARTLHRRPALVDSVLWAVGLQATLSYAASGWVKVTSDTWRSGRALPGVTRTLTYGDGGMYRLLTRYPKTARVLGASVLMMECGFPLVYAAGGRIARPWCHGTASFHLVNARVMGLGRFVWAFGSMHPAVRYTADARNRGVRDDTLPWVTGVMGLGAVAAGFAAQRRRRQRVLQLAQDEFRVRTRSGAELVTRLSGPADADGPVVVLEHGLLSTPLLWGHTAAALEARGHTVATYARAGYGASTYANGDGFDLAHAVEDLVDVATAVGRDRGVVIAGHSLGGYLAVRAAARAPELVRGVALVDSSHPGELQRSSRQAEGQKMISDGLQLVAPSLSLGLGALATKPDYKLPAGAEDRFMDEFRDARLWQAGLREWRATQAEFNDFDGRIAHVECPLVSLTAAHTAELDPIQADLHRELAELSAHGTHAIIDGVDHEGIICDAQAAAAVADHISEVAHAA